MLNQEIRTQTRNAAIGNLLGNAGFGYWLNKDLAGISAEGEQGYIADFLFTGFLLPAILCCIFLFWFRRRAVKGEFDVSSIPSSLRLSWLPRSPWGTVAVITLLGLASVALPLVIYLTMADATPLSPTSFALLKGGWAGLATVVIVPVSVCHAVVTATDSENGGVASHQ